MKLMPNVEETYFLSVFVGGLKEDIRLVVRMLGPNSLAHAFQIPRFQEQFLNTSRKPNRFF